MAFVYLFKANGIFKIGRTGNLAHRISRLISKIKARGELIHTIETNNPIVVEKYWHDKFSEKRVSGEWFMLSSADVREMQKFSKAQFPSDDYYQVPAEILATRPAGDGWRLERFRKARVSDYYQWRRGDGHDNREAKYAGAVRRDTGEVSR